MELNQIVFPCPKLVWDHLDYLGEMLWIPCKKPEGCEDAFVEKCRARAEKVIDGLIKGSFPGFLDNMNKSSVIKLGSDLNIHCFNINQAKFSSDLDERCINSIELTPRKVARPMKIIEIPKREEMFSGSTYDSEQLSYRSFATEEAEPPINEVLFKKHRPRIAKAKEELTGKALDDFFEHYVDHYIPAILIAPPTACGRLFIYYHANAEDIGLAYGLCKEINKKLDVNSS